MRVNADRAGDTRKILGLGNRVAQFRLLRSSRSFDGFAQNAHRIVAERCEGIRNFAMTCLVIGHELLYCGRRIVNRIVVGDEVAVQRITAQIPELCRIPAITAKERSFDIELLRLLCDHADLSVIARNIDNIWVGRANGRQLSFVITIALRIRLLIHDLATEFGEARLKKIRQATTVRRIEVKHDSRAFGL